MLRGLCTVLGAVVVLCGLAPAGAQASITVGNTNDSGAGSLRQVIKEAPPGETIVVPTGTYSLKTGELKIAKSLTISGAGASSTIIRSEVPTRVIVVSGPSTSVTITGGASTSARRGATLTYTDSAPGVTTFSVLAPKRGFLVSHHCQATEPRHHQGAVRRCTRYLSLGTFTHTDAGGAVHLHFTGRVRRKPLALGHYRLQATARSAAGLASRILFTEFRVVR